MKDYRVEVTYLDEDHSLVTIEPRMLAGKSDLTEDDLGVIRDAAQNLLSFAGQPGSTFEPQETQP